MSLSLYLCACVEASRGCSVPLEPFYQFLRQGLSLNPEAHVFLARIKDCKPQEFSYLCFLGSNAFMVVPVCYMCARIWASGIGIEKQELCWVLSPAPCVQTGSFSLHTHNFSVKDSKIGDMHMFSHLLGSGCRRWSYIPGKKIELNSKTVSEIHGWEKYSKILCFSKKQKQKPWG